ncbi:hypothetical protein [Aeoliella sp. SH292]|uniref:hypothetical protein n=1 Tax=Aeoliella sp. SH292 TaxID=3454464 RepID=UPI003F973A3D
MKGKGLDAVKGLALRHGEKVVMALVVAIAAWLVYGTMSHEALPENRSAQNLKTKSQQVSSTVSQFTWPEALESAPEEVREFEPVKSVASVEIPSDPYLLSENLDAPVVPKLELRKDPKLLAVTEFEGSAVTGLFAFLDAETAAKKERERQREAAELERDRALQAEEQRREEERRAGRPGQPGAMDRGFEDPLANPNQRPVATTLPRAGVDVTEDDLIRKLSCAVVMAKVPLPEQLKEYKKVLKETRFYDPGKDFPQYLGYLVERAEVTGDGELKWTKLAFPNGHYNIEGDTARSLPAVTSANDMINRMTFNWAQGMEDEFDPRYAHESLTVPLAPLVARNWGEMAYMSAVPLAIDVEREMMNEQPVEAEGAAPGGEEDLDFGNAFGGAAGGAGPAGRGGAGFAGGGRGRPMGGGAEFGGRGGGRPMGGGGRAMGGGGRGAAMGAGSAQFDENGEMIVDVPFLMLRFFDLTVQPGKRYKYRVKMILSDPNYQVPLDQLDQTVQSRKRGPAIYTEWSEPSMTIAVPQAGIVRVAESKPPRTGYYTEPEATMLVESFSVDPKGNAMQGSIEMPATRRGAVMNYQGPVEVLVQQGRMIEKVENFPIDTGVVVLDLDGGDSYTRELKEPTHALLMDASGRMFLRDELDDEIDVAIHRAVFAETEPGEAGAGGFDPGRGGGRGGGGEFDF